MQLKTVFGHGHTRGSFLSLEPSLVEPMEEPEYETNWVINAVARRLPALQTAFLTQHQHKMECTAEGQACAHSGDPFMLLRLQPSAKTYTLNGSRKALFKGMKHKLSDHLRGNYSTWAITLLCFSPRTFINFSLVVTSSREKRYQALPASEVISW